MAKKKTAYSSDVYTAILGIAAMTVLSTLIFVAVIYTSHYGSLMDAFKVTQ